MAPVIFNFLIDPPLVSFRKQLGEMNGTLQPSILWFSNQLFCVIAHELHGSTKIGAVIWQGFSKLAPKFRNFVVVGLADICAQFVRQVSINSGGLQGAWHEGQHVAGSGVPSGLDVPVLLPDRILRARALCFFRCVLQLGEGVSSVVKIFLTFVSVSDAVVPFGFNLLESQTISRAVEIGLGQCTFFELLAAFIQLLPLSLLINSLREEAFSALDVFSISIFDTLCII